MNIIFLDCTQQFSYKFSAANTKTYFLAKGLSENNNMCTIHNGLVGYDKLKTNNYKYKDDIGNIITYSKKNNQLISWLINMPTLYKDLKKLKGQGNNNWVILEAPDIHLYYSYIILSKLLGYKIAVISHEWLPTIKSTHILRKPLIKLYSLSFGYLVNCILPISEYIIEEVKHFKKPILKVPIIADFEGKKEVEKENFFLYCVYAAYQRVIFKIIESFKLYTSKNKNFKLYLVLSGSEEHINKVKEYIEKNEMKEFIFIYEKLPYEQLINLYHKACALIIPLDPNSEQDKARFSQKIAEYLSSSTPIITNNVGEIGYYFKDKDNIIICDYSLKGFTDAFMWVSNNLNESVEIGRNGYEVGNKLFNYKVVCKKLDLFLNQI